MRTPGGAAPGLPRDLRTQRRRPLARRRRPRANDATTDATTDAVIGPDPGPSPETVFDRITGPYGGPYVHRPALAVLGACEHHEET